MTVGALALLAALALGVYSWSRRPIRIGLLVSPSTALGHEATLAVRYYLDAHPQVGGRPVELVVRTPSLNPDEQRAAFRELERAGVSLIVGAAVSQAGVVQAAESARSGLPTFSVSASTAALSSKSDAFYRLVVDTTACGSAAAKFLSSRYRRVAILTGASNRAYTEAFGAAIEDALAVERRRLSLGDEDAAIAALGEFQPDAVFAIVSPSDLLRVVGRVRATTREVTIFSSDCGMIALPTYSGQNLEDLRFISQNGVPLPRYAEQLEGLTERSDHKPAHTAAYCLSIMELIYQGLREVGEGRAALKAWLDQPRTYDYAYGRVYIDGTGDAIRERWHLFRVHEGQLTLVESLPDERFPEGR
ncbi:MAG TPA: hypothetical protein DEA08_11895 [Planctomycetes bacterium]|nr:hypothetical protein [Planctomycetota bacterium]